MNKPFAPGFSPISIRRMSPGLSAALRVEREKLADLEEDDDGPKARARRLSEDDFTEHRDDGEGLCLTCHRWQEGIDADEDRAACDHCGGRVVGAEHALANDYVEVTDA